MRCVQCGSLKDKVLDSRSSKDGTTIRRRRECLKCAYRYTTYEQIERTELRVVKRDGTRESLNREKLMGGLIKACEKRPISTDAIETLVDNVERACQDFQGKEIPSTAIGEKVMQELQALDGVAYVRFASVYREFRDVSDFLDELRDLLPAKKGREKGN